MQIAVLSDLHLGRRDKLDRFARTNDDAVNGMEALLARLERSVDRIVLLGDVVETLRSAAPLRVEDEMTAALDAHPSFARRLLGDPRYVYVHGNHDVIAHRMLGAPEKHVVDDGGVRVVFFHGHQVDLLARGPAPISRAGVFVGGWIERLGLPFTPVRDARKPWHRPQKGPDVFARLATMMGARDGADVVVTGHTHLACRHEVGDRVFLNSGTCVAGRREFLLLDTTAKKFDVVVDA